MDMSQRTVQLCSHETYEDCPYYEQMQYAGDFYNEMLFAGYGSGDWQLARQGLLQFSWSRGNEGLTQSRYPSRVPQYIPAFSLLWIIAVREYWWHTGDVSLVRECLESIQQNLNWFERHQNRDGLLEAIPYWKFVDWVEGWNAGCPPGAMDGISTIINLQYASALIAAGELMTLMGDTDADARYRQRAEAIRNLINRSCWDDDRKYYLDRPGGPESSELVNAWAILSEAATDERSRSAAEHLVRGELAAKASLYGRFFVFRALARTNAYNRGDSLFDWWYRVAKTDLTTWPEDQGFNRSFCHAWSATPMYEFLAEVLGIKPAEPGFKSIRIAPHPMNLSWAKGRMPFPAGCVEVEWQRTNEDFAIDITGPKGTTIILNLPDGSEEKTVLSGDTLHRSCRIES
jgi:hypothetical protein